MDSRHAAGTVATVVETGANDQPALVVPNGPTLTYRSLRLLIQQGMDELEACGVEQGDRVALALPNGPEAVVLFLAAAMVGAAAPLNPAYKEDEFRFYLEDTRATALVVLPGEGDAARRALPPGAILIEAGIDENGGLRLTSHSGHGTRRGRDGTPSADDVALVLHTSGTTSRPKLVPLRHRNLLASINHIAATYQLGPEDVSLCVMPLFHVHGLLASVLATLHTGGTVIVPRRFNPASVCALASEYGATWYSAVPTIHQMVLMRAKDRPMPTFRFIRSCSSALPSAVMQDLEERFRAPVLEAYGMTEASHQIASNPLPPGLRLPGSVGTGTGVEVAIMDDKGMVLPPESPGEVVIRGPNVTSGYESNPEANAAAFTNGWFRTGDEGVIDERGYLRLIGRIKELINHGGEKIAPREVEETLLLHPSVVEAVAFGVPHEVWGEEVGVAVVLREPVAERDLIVHCREHLADYKVPKKIFVTEQIPRTATGKIQRRFVAAAVTGTAT
jgi:acyl-CoA synthetase (AMP-forming)/AMP-acid ligase II